MDLPSTPARWKRRVPRGDFHCFRDQKPSLPTPASWLHDDRWHACGVIKRVAVKGVRLDHAAGCDDRVLGVDVDVQPGHDPAGGGSA